MRLGYSVRLIAGICCVGAAAALGTILGTALRGPDPGTVPPGAGGLPAQADSLVGTLHCEKSRRLMLYWEDGSFEVWDTENGHRLGAVERLSRPVDWCLASPDEATIVTGDRMPRWTDKDAAALQAQRNGSFVSTVCVWDARSGQRRHLIRVPEAKGDPYYTVHEWYARWLDNSRLLVVRLSRENPARTAARLRLIVVDAAGGKVVKASEDFEYAGEHLFLSPDRKLAVGKDDNYVRRQKDAAGLQWMYRNIHAHTHVFDLEGLTVVSSWQEHPDPKYPGEGSEALISGWCPDGKTVFTAGTAYSDRSSPPNVRLWDARSGRLLKTFTGVTDSILDVALTGSGAKILVASEDRTVQVWDTRTGKREAVLSGHAAGLNKVIVLPGDQVAVSAAEETVAKVWDLSAGKLKFDLPGHDSAVREVEVVSGTVVRTVTRRGTATTWDCSTGKQLQITPKPPDFPRRFGVCELAKGEEGMLHMRVVK